MGIFPFLLSTCDGKLIISCYNIHPYLVLTSRAQLGDQHVSVQTTRHHHLTSKVQAEDVPGMTLQEVGELTGELAGELAGLLVQVDGVYSDFTAGSGDDPAIPDLDLVDHAGSLGQPGHRAELSPTLIFPHVF